MPEVSRFYGIIITMYFDEHNPPHFHAEYGGDKAVISISPAIEMGGWMGKLPSVVGVRYLGGFALELTFSTGEEGVVDYSVQARAFKGMLEPLRDPVFFAQVALEPELGTIVWPNGVDFCPDVLRHRATGKPMPAGGWMEPERTAA